MISRFEDAALKLPMFGLTQSVQRTYLDVDTPTCLVEHKQKFILSQIEGILKVYAYAMTFCICFFLVECVYSQLVHSRICRAEMFVESEFRGRGQWDHHLFHGLFALPSLIESLSCSSKMLKQYFYCWSLSLLMFVGILQCSLSIGCEMVSDAWNSIFEYCKFSCISALEYKAAQSFTKMKSLVGPKGLYRR